MGKTNSHLEAARGAYREALELARTNPSPEAWAKLLAAGKVLSSAQEPKKQAGRRRRRGLPSYQDLEGGPPPEAQEIERLD